LAPYVPGFRDELARQGYAPWSATSYLGLMAHLSRWLGDHRLALAELNSRFVDDFLEERRARGYAKGRSTRGMLGVLTAYLRGLGAMPEAAPSTADTPRERLLAEFAAYLVTERGLAERTITWYRHVAG